MKVAYYETTQNSKHFSYLKFLHKMHSLRDMICMNHRGFSVNLANSGKLVKIVQGNKNVHGLKLVSSWAAHHGTWEGSVGKLGLLARHRGAAGPARAGERSTLAVPSLARPGAEEADASETSRGCLRPVPTGSGDDGRGDDELGAGRSRSGTTG